MIRQSKLRSFNSSSMISIFFKVEVFFLFHAEVAGVRRSLRFSAYSAPQRTLREICFCYSQKSLYKSIKKCPGDYLRNFLR